MNQTKSKLVGIGDTSVSPRGEVILDLWHRNRNRLITEGRFTVIDPLHQNQPQESFSHLMFSSIDHIDLADPSYSISARVDGIIGAEILSEQMQEGLRRNPLGLLAQATAFGWIVFGGPSLGGEPDALQQVNLVTKDELFAQIKKLWEMDDEETIVPMSPQDRDCENLYQRTLVFQNGRYGVTLLLKPDMELGESRTMARRRLYCLESRFKKNPELKNAYVQFMDEYENLGHMRKAEPLAPGTQHYYIPHHAVAIDTKFRVVFDASAKTTNGVSLNNMQYTGPRLQKDLIDIMMNFRTGQFALTADICKMFRQIEVQPAFWDYQRILWRKSQSEPICEYWLTVVTYGMVSSPYNAVKTLIKCAQDNMVEFPRAAQVVENDFYVDDLLTSRESKDEAVQLKGEVIALLEKGGFELAKWRSNCEEASGETLENKFVTDQDSASVLGIMWNYKDDIFQFRVQSREQPQIITKRIMTSEAARVYDPQGYVTPITIRAKLYIQELWRVGSDWDEPMPEGLQAEWKQFCIEIQMIAQIRIPRWLNTTSTTKTQIHVYCDASSKAYGAAAYVRVFVNDVWNATLLCSKSRVAPIKIVTIPRLELSAVELGSSMLRRIKQIPMLTNATTFIWTDSEIALYWLRKPLNELRTFVANRVSRISEIISVDQSRHIRSEQNPADMLSRGVSVESLIGNTLWWNGPEALRENVETWPLWNPKINNVDNFNTANLEVKEPKQKYAVVMLTRLNDKKEDIDLIEKYSSHHKACRVAALVFRYGARLYEACRRNGKGDDSKFRIYTHPSWKSAATNDIEIKNDQTQETTVYKVPYITIIERDNALNYWIRKAQEKSFPKECALVKKGEEVPRSSSLWTLTPQLDVNGLLRIYGRLGNTSLSDATKHPIILHRQSTLARKLAEESHENVCHGGVQMCTQYLRHKYWIVGIRILLRNIVFKCTTCARYRQRVSNQFMADLPAMRLQTVPAFQHTGVDYAGPITLKHSRNTTTKGYIAVFVCMVYKAVHLELVSSLTAEAFIAALTRFVNLRAGSVRHMYSDNGTNFVRADRELQEAAEIWRAHDVMEHLVNHSIEWHFNVPSAPHHGGLWEAAVKSTKYHLKRMGGAHLFTFEELATLLAKITACLNSRPLTPISSDPNDLTTLTPGHFLTGQPIVTPYEGYLEDGPVNRLSAWQKIQKLQQDFWVRYAQEYVTEQQSRNKWAKLYRSLRVGDMVFVKNELTPPSQWLMGRIVQVFPGPDGRVRSCEVKTEKSQLVRPVTRLCLLPIDTPADDDEASENGFS